jgi:Tol biopolymer transport system component
MKNQSIYLVLVFTIIASLAACAAPPTSTGPTAAPTAIHIPPGTIAFSMTNKPVGGDSYTSDTLNLILTDGSGLVQITKEDPLHYFEHPSWSPDGSKIAYTLGSNSCPGYTLWVANADGSSKEKIVDEDICSMWPSWSLDGKHIAFNSYGAEGAQIYIVNPDGTGLKKISDGKADVLPQWAPDGSILFIRNKEKYMDATGEIFSIQADGSGLKQLTDLGGLGGFGISPDGKKIAYYDPGHRQIFVYQLDGSEPPKSIFDVHFFTPAIQPSWSPDGKTIAIASFDYGTGGYGSNLYLVNAESGGFVEVPVENGVVDPAWKPE